MIELDHLVLAASSLDEGVRWLRDRTGIAADPGGSHAGFGTRNALLGLGGGVYLEVLAPDPGQVTPERPRLFGLDEPATREALERGPRLLHWVARATDVPAARRALAVAAGVPVADLGEPTPMRRGGLRWTLTVRADGRRPPAGLPSLIDWGAAPPPGSRLPDRGVALERVEIAVPDPTAAAVRDLLRDARVAFVEGPAPRWRAYLVTPSGPVALGEAATLRRAAAGGGALPCRPRS